MKAVAIRLGDFRSPPMRAFHLSWFAFFLCFFGWFGIAPLMAVVREELALTKEQVGNTIIASVAVTVLMRLLIGWLCDRFGPRRTYSWLLVIGSLPVMSIGLAQTYEQFLLFRLAIGGIGAAFVITQFHTSLMFAPNCVGTANATTAGWGNLGGGVTQIVMPLVFAAFVAFGLTETLSWRLSMVVPGLLLFGTGIAYARLTQDTPEGNFEDLAARRAASPRERGSFLRALRDPRVLALAVLYGACFGVELTINNVAALYFHDAFGLSVAAAGAIAGLFGMMNLFARTLGGFFSDRAGIRFGLRGRVLFLGGAVLLEGIALMFFSQMRWLPAAIVLLVVFSLFVQASEGATFGVVPMVDKKNLGSIAGLVGAGGNVGAVCAGFLFRSESLSTSTAFLILGAVVAASSTLVLVVRFSPEQERAAREEMRESLLARAAIDARPTAPSVKPTPVTPTVTAVSREA